MYKKNQKELIEDFETDIENGLTTQQVEQQRQKYGYNRLDDKKEKPLFIKVILQMRDLTTIILIIAAIVSFYMAITTEHADYLEGIIIITIVIINAVLGVVQEGNAEKAIASLQKVNKQVVRCLRDGSISEIFAEELVPGDIQIIEVGDMLAADARLLESFSLTIDESALTGESLATEKDAELVFGEDVPLGDRSNMLYSGCLVTNGRAVAVVVAIGMQTEIGKIAALLNNEKLALTPLQQKLNKLGRTISIVALMGAAVIFVVGLLQGEELLNMFMTAISLAVAAVPETLMIIVTLTLSFGVQKMVKKRAIIRRLPAVETLGSASVICSDKTGTLTQNKMTTQLVWTNGDEYININYIMTRAVVEVLKMGTLCSDAYIDKEGDEEVGVGTPTELAIVQATEAQDFSKEELEKEFPRVAELPFDSKRKLMTTIHQVEDGTFLSITKGAFDVLDELCTKGDMEAAKHMNTVFGKKALRVIAIAVKDMPNCLKILMSMNWKKIWSYLVLSG